MTLPRMTMAEYQEYMMTIRVVTAETLKFDKQRAWYLGLRYTITHSFGELRRARIARERELAYLRFVGPPIESWRFCECCGQRLPDDQV